MKAGRELDALIAEKVMGLIAYKVQLVAPPPRVRTIDELQRVGSPLPHYSADIAAAWEVVEKADLWSLYGSIGDGPYRACIQFEDREGLMTADTAPLAICLAALKAVSQEEQG